ncbi:MAG: hypothetical protein H6711_18880 [Myxococcales bacterium]|nr:hypothetical protein [Myxococcales bacterium]
MSDALHPRGSRRKRRGSGPGPADASEAAPQPTEASAPAAAAERSPDRSPAVSAPASAAAPRPKVLSIGRYERGDFERVEGMLASFANRRLAQLVPQIARGFFTAATPQEQQIPELRTAFYSFLLYGWRDANGVRVVDLFRRVGPQLDGRLLAALEACEGARLSLVAIEDVNPGKQRIRGRDLLRDEPVTLRDKNAIKTVRAGDRLLCWQIPWGTSWQPIGVATLVEARKAEALDRALESMANNLRAVRRELPERHAANLYWVVYRVAGMRV